MSQRQELKETINHSLWMKSEEFKNRTNMYNTIQMAIDFANGIQYPAENYRNFIRITQNFINFAVLIKSSKINGTPVYLTYTSDNPNVDCTALRRLDEYTCMKLDIQTFGFDACCNAFITGTEITFERFSDNDMSYKGIYKGGIQLEHIDPRDFAVANPMLSNEIQNQEWVMWKSTMSVRALINMLDKLYSKAEKDEITETLYGEATGFTSRDRIKREEINSSMVNVYQRLFRINGEVFITVETEYCSIYKMPRPLNRKLARDTAKKVLDEYEKRRDSDETDKIVDGDVLDFEIDPEEAITTSVNDRILTEAEYESERSKFSLYPIEVFEPFPQHDNFYGRSDVTGMIPTQIAVNHALSMMNKCLENNAYNKIFAKEDALGDQEITNEPGQILIDYSGFTNGWGIKLAESQPLPNGVLDYADRILAQTRVINSFNDVMDGSAASGGGNESGYALNLMIKQSNTSIEQIQRRFWKYLEGLAAIRLQYYRFYYDKATYTYEMDENEYADNEEARKQLYRKAMNGELTENENNPMLYAERTRKTKVGVFTSGDIYGSNFDIAIDAMQGTNDSKIAETQMWQNLFLNGGLQNIDPEILSLYLRSAPDVSPRAKAALENAIEYRKKTYTYELEQKNMELTQALEQVLANAKRLEGQNVNLNTYLKNLQGEFSNKITQQNKLIDAFMKERDSAQKSANTTSGQESVQ